MNPRLVAIAGPLKSATFQLTAGEFSIGRDNFNQIPISDISVSRRHCAIRQEGDSFVLCDTESLNGTFVNETPVKERALQSGDRPRYPAWR